MPVSSWDRWTSQILTLSMAFLLRCPLTRRPLPEILALPSVPLQKSTTICVFCMLAWVLLTALSAVALLSARQQIRLPIKSSRLVRGAELTSWLLLFWVARASTSSSLKTCAKKDFLAFVLTALCVSLMKKSRWVKPSSTILRWLSTVLLSVLILWVVLLKALSRQLSLPRAR